jgi:hypothetical protein
MGHHYSGGKFLRKLSLAQLAEREWLSFGRLSYLSIENTQRSLVQVQQEGDKDVR